MYETWRKASIPILFKLFFNIIYKQEKSANNFFETKIRNDTYRF